MRKAVPPSTKCEDMNIEQCRERVLSHVGRFGLVGRWWWAAGFRIRIFFCNPFTIGISFHLIYQFGHIRRVMIPIYIKAYISSSLSRHTHKHTHVFNNIIFFFSSGLETLFFSWPCPHISAWMERRRYLRYSYMMIFIYKDHAHRPKFEMTVEVYFYEEENWLVRALFTFYEVICALHTGCAFVTENISMFSNGIY